MVSLERMFKPLGAALGALVLAVALSAVSGPAEAKRLGGGKSVGQQSQNVKRDATPATPAAPANATNAAGAGAGAAAAGTAAAATKKPWGAMLGGLAAGLGLAWLASSLGFGEAFGQILMFLLLGVVVMAAVGFFLRKRAQQNNGNQGAPYAFQGAGTGAGQAEAPRQYSASTVGNDASARPWERNSMAFDASNVPNNGGVAQGGSMIGSALRQASGWTIPADFDQAGFLAGAKSNFLLLQAAWDRADVATLRSMMTDDMLVEVQAQLAAHQGAANHTEVVSLDAKLLGIEDLGHSYLASVEFSGMIREDAAQGPQPLREVWNMSKSKSGGGWLVAGLQALS